jgi:ABC-type transport system substrate-binding protein
VWRWLLALAACRPPDRGPIDRAPSETLHIAAKDAVVTLDPTFAYDDASMLAVHAQHATLVAFDRAGAIVPDLAEHWTISADGLDVTFALRADLAYGDGGEIAARDIVAAIERARTMPDSPYAGYVAGIAAISAPDARTVVVRLRAPDAHLLPTLALPFTSPGGERASGPFVLARWDRGRRVVLARNPHYWDRDHVSIAAIELLESVPRETQFLMFESGALDAVDGMASADYQWLASQPAWQPYIHRRALLDAYGSRMNVTKKPFDDRRVRQALNYAIDKTHMLRILGGTAEPAHGVLPPGLAGVDASLAPYPHDPAKARALLAAAGYPHGFEIAYAVQADDEAQRVATSLQADLAEVGVRVRLEVTAFASYTAILGSADGTPFAKAGWIADFPDAASFFEPLFHSRGIAATNATNWSFYANPRVDELIDRARAHPDPAIDRELERILYEDAPWIFEYHQMLVEVTQPYVRDYEPHLVWRRDYTHARLQR